MRNAIEAVSMNKIELYQIVNTLKCTPKRQILRTFLRSSHSHVTIKSVWTCLEIEMCGALSLHINLQIRGTGMDKFLIANVVLDCVSSALLE